MGMPLVSMPELQHLSPHKSTSMSLTIDQLKNLSFGYLNGADLLRYAAPQLLIRQYEVDPDGLENGCDTAYAEIIAKLETRFDLTAELAKVAFTNAAATATITTGAVSAINITNAGTSYASAPAVSFTGGGGSGAAATAVLTGDKVTAINITNAGSGYTSAPTVVLTGGAAADTRARLLVKIAAIWAIRNALGNAQNIAEAMQNHFKWADQMVSDLRNGQGGLPVKQSDTTTVGSGAELIDSSFSTLG
jgi:Ni,Fe-hydrogenase III small subunit